ncbi:MAG: glycosyltransferase family 2 protein [Deltaproteobacteria bacterium]|nr:glycosyltransferase family 2 protein [Deltaproteobacteria bacterium]
MQSPRVSIIILNWNGLQDTLECLDSVKKINYLNFEVIVVDNGSTDNSVKGITKRFPEVTLIATGKNLGFAAGNNVGIRYAINNAAEYILLLNNDTTVDPQLLNAFLEASYLYPEAGILGAKIYYYSEPNKIQFAGTTWNKQKCNFTNIGEGEVDDGITYECYSESDYVCGCALFFKKEVIEKVGYLESKFFLNYEETDWCFRSRRSGYKCLFVPKAKVWHKIAVSFGGDSSPMYEYFVVRNKLLWAERNLSLVEILGVHIRVYIRLLNEFSPRFYIGNYHQYNFIKRIYWATVKYLKDFRKKPSDARFVAQIYGLRDYIIRRFGDCPNNVRNLNKI